MEDPKVAIVKTGPFMANYAPFLPPRANVDACIDLISQGRDPVLIKSLGVDGGEDTYRWRDFFDAPSIVRDRSINKNGTVRRRRKPLGECETLRPVKTIYEAIGSYKCPGRTQTCAYDDLELRTTTELQDGTVKLDASCKLVQNRSGGVATEGHHMADLACAVSYQLDECSTATYKSLEKIFNRSTHAMNGTPLRTHTYSLTVGDSQMAMWYWSRSHCVKSQDFTFASARMTKAEVSTVVSVIMSVLFATQEELGYDPDVHRFHDQEKNEAYYVFHLRDDDNQIRYYRTLDCLFKIPTTGILGRATCVWKVHETSDLEGKMTVPGSTPMVLKDVWTEAAAQGERAIQTEIFADLDNFAAGYTHSNPVPGQPDQIDRKKFDANRPESLKNADDVAVERICQCLEGQKYKQYFMAIIAERPDGPITRRVPRHSKWLLYFGPLFDLPWTSGSVGEPSCWLSCSMGRLLQDVRRKRRYFVLYRDICAAVEGLSDFKTVFTVMKDGFLALRLLALVKWVHRDISGGNIFGYEEAPGTWRGILGDVEYALKDSDEACVISAKTRFGTPPYMAIEVQTGQSMRRSYEAMIAPPEPMDFDAIKAAMKAGESLDKFFSSGTRPAKFDFKHTVFHDVESFMWLTLRFVADRVEWPRSLKLSDEVFQYCMPAPWMKANLLRQPKYMAGLIQDLHPAFGPLAQQFAWIARVLCAFYTRPTSTNVQNNLDLPFKLVDELFHQAMLTSNSPDAPPMLTRVESHDRRHELRQVSYHTLANPPEPPAAPSAPKECEIPTPSLKRPAPVSDDEDAQEGAQCDSDGRAEKHRSKVQRTASEHVSSNRSSGSLSTRWSMGPQ